MTFEDDDDLDEYDLDVFLSERLNPIAFRSRWSTARDVGQSEQHDTAQALALCSLLGEPTVSRYRDQFRITLTFDPAQARDALLSKYSTEATTLGQIREARADLIALMAGKTRDESGTSYTPGEFAAAMIAGAPSPDAEKTVILHVADDLRGKAASSDSRDKLRLRLAEPKTLPGPQTEDEIDLLVAELYDQSPWMRAPIAYIWDGLRDSLREDGVASLPPVLMVGPPACGKTYLAEALAKGMDRAWTRLDGTAMTASFSLSGSEYTWRSSQPGEPIRLIAESGTGNPVIIVDEIEKTVSQSVGGDPKHALLPLLQRSTAARFRCPYLQADVDLGYVGWVLLANSLQGLPAPLLDRVRVFEVGYPSGRHLRQFMERQLQEFDVDSGVVDRVAAEFEAGRITLRSLERIKANMRQHLRRPMLH